jgi:hypothetical protein
MTASGWVFRARNNNTTKVKTSFKKKVYDYSADLNARLDHMKPFLFEPELLSTADTGQKIFRVLDVGSGPISWMGWRLSLVLICSSNQSRSTRWGTYIGAFSTSNTLLACSQPRTAVLHARCLHGRLRCAQRLSPLSLRTTRLTWLHPGTQSTTHKTPCAASPRWSLR